MDKQTAKGFERYGTYQLSRTGILLVDPYNDLLHPAKGSWGGQFHDDFQPQPGDVIIKEHWGSSDFADTDLDQQLKQYDIDRVILIGMPAYEEVHTQ